MIQVCMDRLEASRIVDALLKLVELERRPGGNHSMARYYQGLADRLGDALDQVVPEPSGFKALREEYAELEQTGAFG